ncbi:hypothetical protein TWF694_006258 [Orbilia ellipsospora]|uniref:F-box domain-containing protein n=1 Tax=Orbilia ellipsospora TaxID=2528407 RepID=A0AAV9XRA2_9PEZI
MAGLGLLPAELLSLIGENLNDDDDFLALRLVSRRFNILFRERHWNSLYERRRVHITITSLENLIKISRHPGANYRVQHLLISDRLPYPVNASLYKQKDGNFAWIKECKDNDDDIVRVFKSLNIEREDLAKSGELMALFAMAFTNLPNIHSIKIEETPLPLTRKDYNLFYPSLGFSPGRRLPVELTRLNGSSYQPSFFGSPITPWKSILSAIFVAKLSKIQIIDSGNSADSGVPIRWFNGSNQRYATFGSLFRDLTTLRLLLDNEGSNASTKGLCRWITSSGVSLKSLALGCRNSFSNEPRYFRTLTIGDCKLPKLERFVLWRCRLSCGDVQLCVESCQGTLKSMRFIGCHWDGEDGPRDQGGRNKFIKEIQNAYPHIDVGS